MLSRLQCKQKSHHGNCAKYKIFFPNLHENPYVSKCDEPFDTPFASIRRENNFLLIAIGTTLVLSLLATQFSESINVFLINSLENLADAIIEPAVRLLH